MSAEHFVQPPHWEWYILGYFFFGGLSAGSYALATILRLWGSPRDEVVARIGFRVAFPLLIVCPILLTIDLGQPSRFFHMLINTTPGQGGLIFKSWSPMSVGTWALLAYGFFSLVSYLEVLVLDGRIRHPSGRALTRALSGSFGRGFNAVGAVFAFYIASYTGVLLSVSNQPIWSDTWTLGGLFLASALSGSAALLSWLARNRRDAAVTERRLQRADGYFALLELLLIVAFFITLGAAGTLARALAGAWWVVWVLVVASLVPSLAVIGGRRGQPAYGSAASRVPSVPSAAFPLIVLVGVFLMRFAVVFSAQV